MKNLSCQFAAVLEEDQLSFSTPILPLLLVHKSNPKKSTSFNHALHILATRDFNHVIFLFFQKRMKKYVVYAV